MASKLKMVKPLFCTRYFVLGDMKTLIMTSHRNVLHKRNLTYTYNNMLCKYYMLE